MAPTSPRLLLLLLAIASFVATAATGEEPPPTTTAEIDDAYRISAPDIYPTDKIDYIGDVLVKLVANSPDCDIFYTRDGSIPTPKSRYYSTPFPIFEPGRWTISAIAVPRSGSMFTSVVKQRSYNVLPAKVAAPSVTPEKGTYRGQVSVTLNAAEPVLEGTRIQYATDVDDPGDAWQIFDLKQPILLDTAGEHIILARSVIGEGNRSDTRSPTARYRFIVTPALTYDVSTECIKCEKKPTVGHVFTVFLQNPEADSYLFLTTSRMGCQNEKHMLDDTSMVRVAIRQPAYKFATYTDAEPRVFVCLKEPSTAAEGFKIVPRRIKVSGTAENSDGSFAIQPPIGNFQRVTNLHTSPQYVGTNTYHSSGSTSSAAFPLVAFGILFFAVMGAAYTILKFSSTRNPHQRRTLIPTQQQQAEMTSRSEMSGSG